MIDLLQLLRAVVGIGLVIFVHEAGHFMAARWCGVRVHVFSLGMGPRIFGFRRGETLYQIAAIPVGGFVTMAGELPDGTGRAPASYELPAKTVGQRFLVYSGGVLMNLALALVLFPILFAVGVPFMKPVVGSPVAGGPLWTAGVEPGTEILAVNGNDVFDELHVATEVALSDPEQVALTVLPPGSDTPREVNVVPVYNDFLGMNGIGLGRPALHPDHTIDVAEGTPAWKAGMRPGDRLLGAGDLPEYLRLGEQLRLAMAQDGPLAITYRAEASGEEHSVLLEPDYKPGPGRARLGILPARCVVRDLRESAALEQLGLELDDVLIAVGEHPILGVGDLPLGWLAVAPDAPLTIERDGERLQLERPPLDGPEVFALADDIAIGLDYEGLRLTVNDGEGAYVAGLRSGDRIVGIDEIDDPTWDEVFETVRLAAEEDRPVECRVVRHELDGNRSELTFAAAPVPQPDPILDSRYNAYGFGTYRWEYTFRADGPLDAIRVGLGTSWQFVKHTWLTLRGMLLSEISTKNIGGPIAIGQISYALAERGTSKLLYFLCLLSVNLAVINVLPIPVFDGGHLLFLLVEKVKGSPVSERVVGYSQLVGVVFIVGLFVYVTYNDIVRVLQ